jgi:hypothetical protein
MLHSTRLVHSKVRVPVATLLRLAGCCTGLERSACATPIVGSRLTCHLSMCHCCRNTVANRLHLSTAYLRCVALLLAMSSPRVQSLIFATSSRRDLKSDRWSEASTFRVQYADLANALQFRQTDFAAGTRHRNDRATTLLQGRLRFAELIAWWYREHVKLTSNYSLTRAIFPLGA